MQKRDAQSIQSEITERFEYDLSMTVDDIRPNNRFNESCQITVPQALVCALAATSFEDAIRNAISIGGDSDTIAAIAGSIAEARFGIDESLASTVWQKLPVEMRVVMTGLYRFPSSLSDLTARTPLR